MQSLATSSYNYSAFISTLLEVKNFSQSFHLGSILKGAKMCELLEL